MKKLTALAIIICLCLPIVYGLSSGVVAEAATEVLYVYNWAEYISEDLLGEFEEYYYQTYKINLRVEYEVFDTNEIMLTKVLMGDTPYDLICPSEYTIEKLMKRGALIKMDMDKIPNIGNVDPMVSQKITEVFSDIEVDSQMMDMTEYMVPYMWGTLGILYNEKYVTDADLEAGWGLLWNQNNNPALNKKIYMKDSVRDSYVAAVLYAKEQDLLPDGYDELSVEELINTVDDELLAVVERVLKEQQKVINGYEVDFGKEEMIAENVYASLAWSGDALYAIESAWDETDGEVSLNYLVPEIGSNVWFDGWAIPTTSKNTKAAYEFINFLLSPDSAVRNMMEIGYTSAVDPEVLLADEDALAIIEEEGYDIEEFFIDEIRYPYAFFDTLGVMRDFGDKSEAAMMMWENIKPGATVPLIIILSIILGGIGIAVGAFILVDRLKGRYRVVS